MRGLAFVTRFAYGLSLDVDDAAEEIFGDVWTIWEGVGEGGIIPFVEEYGEVGTFEVRGDTDRLSGDDERGDDTAGV